MRPLSVPPTAVVSANVNDTGASLNAKVIVAVPWGPRPARHPEQGQAAPGWPHCRRGSFGVGALAYLLKNRFYIGEVLYGGEVHRGDHAPILDRALFAAVQARFAAHAVERRCRLRASAALLTGRLFDERGNRMSPSHTNKGGARYRYYVSQAVLQNKAQTAGAIGRVPAADIEALVMEAVRRHLEATGTAAPSLPDNARELIERHVERVTLTAKHIKLHWRKDGEAALAIDAGGEADDWPEHQHVTTITIPWTCPDPAAERGIIHVPAYNTPMKPSRREALLTAIAKARQWIEDLAHGRVASFAAIARREGKVERHIRLLAPLAFVSPGSSPPSSTARRPPVSP